MAYFKLSDFPGIPYQKYKKGYKGFDKLIQERRLMTETHCKQIDAPVLENEKPVALKYISVKGKSGFVGLYDRTKELEKINIIHLLSLKKTEMISEVYTKIGISRSRKSMKQVGFLIDKTKGYQKVYDVSNEPEYLFIEDKMKNLEITEPKIIKKENNVFSSIVFTIENKIYELSIDRRGKMEENGAIQWRYVPGVVYHDECIFCKNEKICPVLYLYKDELFEKLINHNKIRLEWILNN